MSAARLVERGFRLDQVRSPPTPAPLRIAYVSGPSEAARIHAEMLAGRPPTYFGTNYMQKFLQFVTQLDARVLVETWHGDGPERIRRGRLSFNNDPPARGSGIRYHTNQLWKQTRLLARLMHYRPAVLILTGHQEFWWIYAPLRLFGTKFVATIHGLLWTPHHPLKRHQKLYRWLNRAFAYPRLDAAVVTSHEIGKQLTQELGDRSGRVPIYHHLPSYDPSQFAGITPVEDLAAQPFRVFFSGRVEANKGVFDLVDVAEQLERQHPGEFRFEMCGDGSDLERLRKLVRAHGLDAVVTCHGYCEPQRMRETIGRCHIAVVPTRSEVPAGFEMTCAEAVLSGRPLIASAACPALYYLREASLEVAPDQVAQYRDAIVELRDNPALAHTLRQASAKLSAPFYDEAHSWDRAMRDALDHVLGIEPGRSCEASREAAGAALL